MKRYWRRSGGWATASKDSPLRSARLRFTALYVVHTIVILAMFVAVLSRVRAHYLQANLQGQFRDTAQEQQVIGKLQSDLEEATALLLIVVLLGMAFVSYFAVQLILRPIRRFLESHRRFIADASHELRTPLAIMRTEIEVALLDPEDLSKQEAVNILRSNAEEIERMSRILTNLLNLASFHDASGEPPMIPTPMQEVIERVVERLKKSVTAKRIELRTDEVNPVTIRGNAVALEEIVSNLLKNAINYTPPGGTVSMSLRAMDDAHAELTVRDTGVGIPPEELPHIFEPFYRSERSFHMHKTGSGLGLPIVKEMIKRHRGSIRVESTPDQGTSVIIHLPLVRVSKK